MQRSRHIYASVELCGCISWVLREMYNIFNGDENEKSVFFLSSFESSFSKSWNVCFKAFGKSKKKKTICDWSGNNDYFILNWHLSTQIHISRPVSFLAIITLLRIQREKWHVNPYKVMMTVIISFFPFSCSLVILLSSGQKYILFFFFSFDLDRNMSTKKKKIMYEEAW